MRILSKILKLSQLNSFINQDKCKLILTIIIMMHKTDSNYKKTTATITNKSLSIKLKNSNYKKWCVSTLTNNSNPPLKNTF